MKRLIIKLSIPLQEKLSFDNVRILYDKPIPFLLIATPIDFISVSNSNLQNNSIKFLSNKAMTNYLKTTLSFINCSFAKEGDFTFLTNQVDGKYIQLNTLNSTELGNEFKAHVEGGKGTVVINSDLTGLKKQ